MEKLLSIVIPVYKVEKFIDKCIGSLIVPDEKQLPLLDIVVINDGTPDNSAVLAREWEKKYPDIIRVIDKENGNYGSCVNRGLKEATGKYIKVLDADDWFDTAEFAKYLTALMQMDVDLVLTDYSIVDAGSMNASLAYKPNLQEGIVYTFRDCNVDEVGIYTMHAVTYRTQMLRDIGYTQTEGISYTDSEWVHLPLYAVNTMAYVNLTIYQYLVGREGQTMDPKVMMRTINHHAIIAHSLIENEEKHPSDGFVHVTIQHQIEYLLIKVYRTRLALQEESSFNQKEMATFDVYIKEHRPDMYKRMGRLPLKNWLPIPYVLYWRIFGHRFPVDRIRDLYRRIRYGKAKD